MTESSHFSTESGRISWWHNKGSRETKEKMLEGKGKTSQTNVFVLLTSLQEKEAVKKQKWLNDTGTKAR